MQLQKNKTQWKQQKQINDNCNFGKQETKYRAAFYRVCPSDRHLSV